MQVTQFRYLIASCVSGAGFFLMNFKSMKRKEAEVEDIYQSVFLIYNNF